MKTNPPSSHGLKKLTDKQRRTLLALLRNTILIMGAYYGALALNFTLITPIYAVSSAILVAGFLIYNYGFTRRGITEEMLPDTMSDAEKVAYIENTKMREDKSRWLLTVILPFLFVLFAEFMILYMAPWLRNLLGI